MSDILTLTPEFTDALAIMESGVSPIFLTGQAGTGKSTLLTFFREQTNRTVAVVAPTGVAALNVGGQTIHSFFKFRPDTTPEHAATVRLNSQQLATYRHLQTLIVDEVSMVRADLLDCIEAFLRKFGPRKGQPFGGVQIILIGDLYQLPPVVTSRDGDRFVTEYETPYFFSAHCLGGLELQRVQLNQVFRQEDDSFVRILNAVRSNDLEETHLETLNSRFLEMDGNFDDEVAITLTSTNDLADRVNQWYMDRLETKSFTHKGKLTGTFGERDLPTQQELILKIGAQVMLLNNDPNGRWVNGSIGKIVDSYASEDKKSTDMVVAVELSTGARVEVTTFTWEQFVYTYNEEKEEMDTDTTGAFTQFPLRPAWAVTIHKAQGKTFDRVIIDLGRGAFSHGQTYVALSRARTLDGIQLRQPLEYRHIIMDPRIVEFLT